MLSQSTLGRIVTKPSLMMIKVSVVEKLPPLNAALTHFHDEVLINAKQYHLLTTSSDV